MALGPLEALKHATELVTIGQIGRAHRLQQERHTGLRNLRRPNSLSREQGSFCDRIQTTRSARNHSRVADYSRLLQRAFDPFDRDGTEYTWQAQPGG